MNEKLFQFIWKHSLFNPSGLKTTDGEPLTVIHPGIWNKNSGPDFLEARVRIGETTWVGNIELHIFASDWRKHKHNFDNNYNNIILHVTYIYDITEENGKFPATELKDNISQDLLDHYDFLMKQLNPVACAYFLPNVPLLIMNSWLERMLVERWEHKLQQWNDLWEKGGRDWRSLLYLRLASNFGFFTNRDAFLDLALSIPFNILVKHRDNLTQIEALLFGQSGLLKSCKEDDYTRNLEKEYHFLRRKYQLSPLEPHKWKFLRLRPQNFPTVRIAQFAMLIHKSINLFSKIMEVKSQKELLPLLDVSASTYWDEHYRLGEKSEYKLEKRIGKSSIYNIAINTVAPMQFLYAQELKINNLYESSLQLLQSFPSEDNHIIRDWKKLGIPINNASESQALLHLFDNYCLPRKCLDCRIGNHIFKSNSNS